MESIYDRIKSFGYHGVERRDVFWYGRTCGLTDKEIGQAITQLKEQGRIKAHRQGCNIDDPLWYYTPESGLAIGSRIIGKA